MNVLRTGSGGGRRTHQPAQWKVKSLKMMILVMTVTALVAVVAVLH